MLLITQVLFAVGNASMFALILQISRSYRGNKCVSIFKTFMNAHVSAGSLKDSLISLFTNVAVTAALFASIQFGINYAISSDANSTISMFVFATLWNSMLASLMTFVISMHSILLLSILDEKGVRNFLTFTNSFLGIPLSGYDICGLVVITSDLTILWLMIAILFWILDSLENAIAMALYWCMGCSVVVFCSEYSYNFLFNFFERTKDKELFVIENNSSSSEMQQISK